MAMGLFRENIQMTTSATQQGMGNECVSPNDSFGATMTYSLGGDRAHYEQLLENERKNFKLFHTKVRENSLH